MSDGNIWLEQRLAEERSMLLEIEALEAQPGEGLRAVRGAGVCGRSGYSGAPVPITLTTRPGRP